MAVEREGIAVEISAELERFEANMRRAGRTVENATGDMDRSTRRAASAFNRLEGRLDPVAKATQRLERDTAKVQRALDKGAVSADRAANVQRRLNDQYEQTLVRLGRMDTAQLRANRVVEQGSRRLSAATSRQRNFGLATQNAAFQVGDFATQMASGQSATRALAQQLPQLLGGFGVMGAVIGGVVAVAGALAPVLLNIGDNTETADDATRTYSESLQAVNEITERLNNAGLTRIERLRQEANEALKGAEAEQELARARLESLRAEITGPVTGAAQIRSDQINEAEERLNEARQRVTELRERLNTAIAEESERLEENSDERDNNREAIEAQTSAAAQAIQKLKENIALQRMDARERAQTTAVMQAQNAAMERGNLLTTEQVQRIRELAGVQFDLRNTSEETEEASQKVRDLGLEFQSTSEIMLESTREFVRGSQGELADFVDDFFKREVNSISDLWDGMLDVMRRSLSEFIAAVATQRIILPVGLAAIGGGGVLAGTGGGGGIGGASNVLSAGGQLASLGGFDLGASLNSIGFSSGIFGAGSSGAAGALNVGSSVGVNGFNIAGASSAAPPSATGIFGTSATLSGTLGAAGLGALGGGLLTNLVGLNQTGGSIGGGLGAGAGFLLGSATALGGPIGAGIGGLLGALGGGAIGDLFGSQPSRAISASFNDRGGQLVRTRLASDEASDEQERAFRELSQRVTATFNQFARQIGAEIGDAANFGIRQTRRDGTQVTGLGRTRSFGNLSEAVDFALRESLRQSRFEGLSEDIESAIRRGLRRGQSLDEIAQEAQRLRQRDQIALQANLGVRQNVFGAASSIQGFLDQQRLSQDSSLSPAERLTAAQRQFQQQLNAVRGGEVGATQGLLQSAETLLGLGRDRFASTVSFANLEQSVRSQLAQVGQRLTSESFINDQVTTAIQQQTTAQLDSDQATRDTINDLKREIRTLRQELADIVETQQAA